MASMTSTPADTKKKRIRGKVHIDAEACKGCGFCVAFCPTHALGAANSFNQKGYHPPVLVDEYLCSACGLCGMFCPDFAIYSTKFKEQVQPADENHDDEMPYSEKINVES